MKVGTDGVLLGAWTPVESSARILDIGTGTGLVALMLAQRCSASVIALEINGTAATTGCREYHPFTLGKQDRSRLPGFQVIQQ